MNRSELAGLAGWIKWIEDVEHLLHIAEPILVTLVDIRNNSGWVKLPILRRLRPPAEVETALRLLRALKERLP